MIAAAAEIVLVFACGLALYWSRRLPHYGFEFVLCGLIGFLPAVLIGAVEYAGYPGLHPMHQATSDIGAAVGLPLLMIGLAAASQDLGSLRHGLWAFVLFLPLGGLFGVVRLPGQVALVCAVVALGVATWRRHSTLLPAWGFCAGSLAGAMVIIRFRGGHGDFFEALFHLLLALFVASAAWLSRRLAGRPDTVPASDRSGA